MGQYVTLQVACCCKGACAETTRLILSRWHYWICLDKVIGRGHRVKRLFLDVDVDSIVDMACYMAVNEAL